MTGKWTKNLKKIKAQKHFGRKWAHYTKIICMLDIDHTLFRIGCAGTVPTPLKKTQLHTVDTDHEAYSGVTCFLYPTLTPQKRSCTYLWLAFKNDEILKANCSLHHLIFKKIVSTKELFWAISTGCTILFIPFNCFSLSFTILFY